MSADACEHPISCVIFSKVNRRTIELISYRKPVKSEIEIIVADYNQSRP